MEGNFLAATPWSFVIKGDPFFFYIYTQIHNLQSGGNSRYKSIEITKTIQDKEKRKQANNRQSQTSKTQVIKKHRNIKCKNNKKNYTQKLKKKVREENVVF